MGAVVVRVLALAVALSVVPSVATASTLRPCAMVMAASAADALYSWDAVHSGRAAEANPMLQDAIQWPKLPFLGVKLLLTAPVCIVIDQQKRPRDKWVVGIVAAGVYTFLAAKAARIK